MARTVACALVNSRLYDANSVLYGTSVANIAKLQRVQNALAATTIRNDLPLDSRSAETNERFRFATKKHFFTNWLLQTDRMTVSAPTIRFF